VSAILYSGGTPTMVYRNQEGAKALEVFMKFSSLPPPADPSKYHGYLLKLEKILVRYIRAHSEEDTDLIRHPNVPIRDIMENEDGDDDFFDDDLAPFRSKLAETRLHIRRAEAHDQLLEFSNALKEADASQAASGPDVKTLIAYEALLLEFVKASEDAWMSEDEIGPSREELDRVRSMLDEMTSRLKEIESARSKGFGSGRRRRGV
jgi:hypothetical protein